MIRSAVAALQIAFLALPLFAQTAPSLVTAEDGTIIARDRNGKVLWQQLNNDAGPGSASAATSPMVAATATWEPYTTLAAAPGSTVAGPVFDATGNGWVVVGDNVNLSAIQWDHATGTWLPPHVLGPAPLGNTDSVGLAIDKTGTLYITYCADPATGQDPIPVMWAKYSPSAGWQEPAAVYLSSNSVYTTQPSIDSMGRLVLVFNGHIVFSRVYDPATSSWGDVQTVVPTSSNALEATVAANSSGTRLALIYLQGSQMQYSFFDSAAGKWNPPATVPDSQFSTIVGGGSAPNYFPVAVDEAGNVTFAAATNIRLLYGATGFRYEGGKWTATKLVPTSRRKTVVDVFGTIAINALGEVLIAAPANNGAAGSKITVFRYTPGKNWTVETAATYPSSRAGRCKIAWFQSDQAVVAYVGADDTDGLQNALYSNGKWGPGPHLPGTVVSFLPGIGTDPTGDVLLTLSETSDGAISTWLRP